MTSGSFKNVALIFIQAYLIEFVAYILTGTNNLLKLKKNVRKVVLSLSLVFEVLENQVL